MIRMVFEIIIFFGLWIVLSGCINVKSNKPVIWRFWAEAVPLISILILSLVFWLVDQKQVNVICSMLSPADLLIVLFVGCLWILVPIWILYNMKLIHFESNNKIESFSIWVISCVLNVIMQELLIRGYVYQLIKLKMGLFWSILITTLIFALLHGDAFSENIISVLCVISMSLVMSFSMEKTNSIFTPILLHSLWNIIGALIFNVVYLADDYPHLKNATIKKKKLFDGGLCGIEGSIVVLAVNLISGIFWIKK